MLPWKAFLCITVYIVTFSLMVSLALDFMHSAEEHIFYPTIFYIFVHTSCICLLQFFNLNISHFAIHSSFPCLHLFLITCLTTYYIISSHYLLFIFHQVKNFTCHLVFCHSFLSKVLPLRCSPFE